MGFMELILFEKNEIHPEAIKLLKKNGIKAYAHNNPVIANNTEAVFIRTYTKINHKFLKKYPNLKYILRAGVGLDNIDIRACESRRIQIFNSPGSNANATAELVISYMIMLCRKLDQQINSLKKGRWRQRKFLGEEIRNKAIGLIGCGASGRLLAEKLQSFGVKKIIGYDPFLSREALEKLGIRKVSLFYLLRNSDFISLHLPLLPETRNLIAKKEFSLMKKKAFIINTSRGEIVNEDDLIKALKNGEISGAALDVFKNEPEINREFFSIPNVIATPHIGSFTKEADQAMSLGAVQNFLNYIHKNQKK